MEKQILRKRISIRVEGTKEIIENEYYSLDDFLTEYELGEICKANEDDDESAYDNGVVFGFDGDLCMIDGDKFLAYLENYLENNKDDEDIVNGVFGMIKKKIEQYKGFNIRFE